MAFALSKLEGQITVPTGGYTMTVTDSGGTKQVTVLTAGTYFLNSASNLLTTIGAALTADSTLAGTYTLSSDDNSTTSTGKTTITVTGGGNPSITWDFTALRDALGYTGNLSGAATYQSTASSPYLFLPDVKRSEPMSPDGNTGMPKSDATFTLAPTGTSKALKYATRYTDVLSFRYLSGTKTWQQYEVVTNESLQSFWNTVLTQGFPFRYHYDRATDGSFVSYRYADPGNFPVKTEYAGLVGTQGTDGSVLRWAVGPLGVIQYV